MRTVTATRYVTALREGGSLPGLVEADDDGLYVVKFRGAGQGPRALVAEWLAGELAGRSGCTCRTSCGVELDPSLGDAEPHEEIRDLVHASGGRNLGPRLPAGRAAVQPGRRECGGDASIRPRRPRSSGSTAWSRTRTARSRTRTCSSGTAGRGSSTTAPRCTSITRGPIPTRTPGAGFERLADHVLLPFAGFRGGRRRAAGGPDRRGPARGLVAALPDDWLPGRPGGRRRRRAAPRLRALPHAAAGVAATVRRGCRACPRRRVTCSSTRSCGSCRASSAASSSTPA